MLELNVHWHVERLEMVVLVNLQKNIFLYKVWNILKKSVPGSSKNCNTLSVPPQAGEKKKEKEKTSLEMSNQG